MAAYHQFNQYDPLPFTAGVPQFFFTPFLVGDIGFGMKPIFSGIKDNDICIISS